MAPRIIKYLTLIVTEQCNLSCRYCYRGESGRKTMDPLHARQAIDLAAESGEAFHIQITGGEPLLAWETVRGIISHARNIQCRASIGVQTNGTLLNEKAAEFFKKHSVQVGVSLDGPPRIHDRLRGGAAQTLKGMKTLSLYGVPFRVTTVVTADNAARLGETAMLMGAFPTASGMALDLLVNKGAALKNKVHPPSPQDLARGAAALWHSLNFVNSRRTRPIALREAEVLAANMNKPSRGVFCHAQQGRGLAVAPGGGLYPCGQTAGDSGFWMGRIGDEPWAPVSGALAGPLNLPECRDCQAREACAGDCPSRLHYNRDGGLPLSCTLTQTIHRLMTSPAPIRKAG